MVKVRNFEEAKTLHAFMGSLFLAKAIFQLFFIGVFVITINKGLWRIRRPWSFRYLTKTSVSWPKTIKSINRHIDCILLSMFVADKWLIHTAFAFKMYRKIIELFGWRILNATVVIGAIFVVAYSPSCTKSLHVVTELLTLINPNSKRGFRSLFSVLFSKWQNKETGDKNDRGGHDFPY